MTPYKAVYGKDANSNALFGLEDEDCDASTRVNGVIQEENLSEDLFDENEGSENEQRSNSESEHRPNSESEHRSNNESENQDEKCPESSELLQDTQSDEPLPGAPSVLPARKFTFIKPATTTTNATASASVFDGLDSETLEHEQAVHQDDLTSEDEYEDIISPKSKLESSIQNIKTNRKQLSNAMTKNAQKMRDRHNHVRRTVINYEIDNLVSVLIPSIDRAGSDVTRLPSKQRCVIIEKIP